MDKNTARAVGVLAGGCAGLVGFGLPGAAAGAVLGGAAGNALGADPSPPQAEGSTGETQNG